MQSTHSRPGVSKSGIGGGKSKLTSLGTQQTRNTSGGDSGGAGKATTFWIDGREVSPKILNPSSYLKDAKKMQPTIITSFTDGQDQPMPKEDPASMSPVPTTPAAPVNPIPAGKGKPVKPQGLSKEELERNVDLILSETETETLLCFPSLSVAFEHPNSNHVQARNKAYEELQSSKDDSDRFHEQHAQTLNQAQKAKEVFAAPPEKESVEINANVWDIYDTFATDPVPKHELIHRECEKQSAAIVSQAVKRPGCLFTMEEPYPTIEAAKEEAAKAAASKEAKRAKEAAKMGTTTRSGGVGAGVSKMSVGTTKGLEPTLSTTAHSFGVQQVSMATEDRIGGPTSPGAGTGAGTEPEAGTEQEASSGPADAILWKVGADNPIPDEMAPSLRIMERIVAQNVFHKQHMIYRNYPTLEELARLDAVRMGEVLKPPAAGETMGGPSIDASVTGRSTDVNALVEGDENQDDAGPEELQEEVSHDGSSTKPWLQDLFCFDAPQLTRGMTVTCADWNDTNKDLLAVSYGDTLPVPEVQGGLVLFWSLKNPTYPERVIRTREGVTALNFSKVHPNQVAAGTHDGSVIIWDLRRPSDAPVLRSGSSTSKHNDQKHTDVVWETRWVDRGPDKQPQELIVTVSSDGQVKQWSMKKGLEQAPLMTLKRIPNRELGASSVYGHKEGIVISRSSGLCVDFPRNDASTYLVGTEDGLVHKCSTSYNEQYLETYFGHAGPVYRVRFNPFLAHAFLTCSADWSMKLWTTKPVQGHAPNAPLLTFQSGDLLDAVNDVVWAPHLSTSFAACMDDGRVELWDLFVRPVDPIVVHYPQASKPQRKRTCIRFSSNSPVLICGDKEGSVDVMRMHNTNQLYYSDQEQQDRLNTVMMKKR